MNKKSLEYNLICLDQKKLILLKKLYRNTSLCYKSNKFFISKALIGKINFHYKNDAIDVFNDKDIEDLVSEKLINFLKKCPYWELIYGIIPFYIEYGVSDFKIKIPPDNQGSIWTGWNLKKKEQVWKWKWKNIESSVKNIYDDKMHFYLFDDHYPDTCGRINSPLSFIFEDWRAYNLRRSVNEYKLVKSMDMINFVEQELPKTESSMSTFLKKNGSLIDKVSGPEKVDDYKRREKRTIDRAEDIIKKRVNLFSKDDSMFDIGSLNNEEVEYVRNEGKSCIKSNRKLNLHYLKSGQKVKIGYYPNSEREDAREYEVYRQVLSNVLIHPVSKLRYNRNNNATVFRTIQDDTNTIIKSRIDEYSKIATHVFLEIYGKSIKKKVNSKFLLILRKEFSKIENLENSLEIKNKKKIDAIKLFTRKVNYEKLGIKLSLPETSIILSFDMKTFVNEHEKGKIPDEFYYEKISQSFGLNKFHLQKFINDKKLENNELRVKNDNSSNFTTQKDKNTNMNTSDNFNNNLSSVRNNDTKSQSTKRKRKEIEENDDKNGKRMKMIRSNKV